MSQTMNEFDVAIMGTGISGSLLACILAKYGVRVLMVDSGSHPRFAIGESMVAETLQLLHMIHRRFKLPEASYIAHPRKLCENIASTSGVKLLAGFCYHHEGERPKPEHLSMTPLLTPECHYYRQDVDAYYFHLAIHLGATARQNTSITEIELDNDKVTLVSSKGEKFRSSFVVDAAGFGSPLAKKLGLRISGDTMRTHSRSLFTHMIDVAPFEKSVIPRSEHGFSVNFFQGTTHHLFEGGWIWVIPFNNHRHSTSSLCSVGMQLDPRIYGPPQDPETEFYTIIKRYPALVDQFRSARRVRDWVVAPRLQYTAANTAGDRYCLMAHSTGFVDPLYSRGLVITFEAIAMLAPRLIEAVQTNEFHREKFQAVARQMEASNASTDKLVSSSYTSFRSFELWNAWNRIWVHGALLGTQRIRKLTLMHDDANDAATSQRLEGVRFMGSMSKDWEPFERVFDQSVDLVADVRAGQRSASDAASRILGLIGDAEQKGLLPQLNMGDASNRLPVAPEPDQYTKLMTRVDAECSEELKDLFFGMGTKPPPDMGHELRLNLE